MNETTKESKFLDAINKYAEKQKATISTEVEEYKNQRIEQATSQGLKDAYELIQRVISQQKAELITQTAEKETALRTEQFTKRSQICEEVFSKARERLIAYTGSDGYTDYIRKSAQEVQSLFGKEAVTVAMMKKDLRFVDVIKAILPNVEFKEDVGIRIGGFKAFCKASGILADETLDTKLEDQREWFIENSGLKVV